MEASRRTRDIIAQAREVGFGAAGVARVEPMDPTPLRAWLAAGYGADMAYLARHLPLRAHLANVLPGARSVICALLPYPDGASGPVAKYARGADYHGVVRARLGALWDSIRGAYPQAAGRIFVDSGPLPERELARRAGLGWVGKHACLLHPQFGSRFVLGEIVTTLELAPTEPLAGHCGPCRACLDACPTGALVAPGVVDARRCLSYLTIEHTGAIPRELRPQQGTRLFGCDACQDACPHNRAVGDIDNPLTPHPALRTPDLCAVVQMDAVQYHARFRGAALHRAKRRGLLRNACVALGNLGDPASLPALRQALCDAEPLIRGHAAWALGRLGQDTILRAAAATERDPWVQEEIAWWRQR